MVGKPCSNGELTTRVVALEAAFDSFKDLMTERDLRYSQRAAAQDNAVSSALETSEKAIVKAESATEKRFDSVNEFRATLADQATKLLPRAEFDVQHAALTDRVQLNENRFGTLQKDLSSIHAHSVGMRETLSYMVAAASAIVALVVWLIHH